MSLKDDMLFLFALVAVANKAQELALMEFCHNNPLNTEKPKDNDENNFKRGGWVNQESL